MDLKVQKRLAAQSMHCSKKRISFDTERLEEIKEAITKNDIRTLVNDRAIIRRQKKGVSRGRAKKNILQKREGRRRSYGSRKGGVNARFSTKRAWILRVRSQRELLEHLRTIGAITSKTFKDIYRKSKGGFFRSKRHIRLYLQEHNLVTKNEKTK